MAKYKSDDELIQKTDIAIAELVYNKDELQKAYNYYNGKRDAEQFKYLEENFGIGNPTSVEFTPLIRKHVDALIGEYLGTPILPKISCKDAKTISAITREKELHITSEVYKTVQQHLQSKILQFLETGETDKLQDPYIKETLDTLVEDLNTNFISQYEIASQDVLQYIMQNRQTDFKTKLWTLIKDLLVSGYTFYQTAPTAQGNNVGIEVLDPLNTFIDKNPNSPYVKDSYRVVVRRWLTKSQILTKYGKDMSQDDINELKENWQGMLDYSERYIRMIHTQGCQSAGIIGDQEAVVIPGQPSQKHKTYNPNYAQIPVFEVEWIETDKDFKMQLYQTVRIGQSMYILRGLKEDVTRSADNPNYCSLTVNGVYFDNRSSEPFSLVLACANLQDKYDLLIFYRDNLIANSGTSGDWIDESLIPTNLGVNWPERLKAWLAYKKQGLGLIDTSQEGRLATGQAPINTIFNGFDDTVKAQAIQAIQIAIDSVEQTCSSISGVFRERLNGIEAHDAVTNVKIGQSNSFTISKQWYSHMDVLTEEILTDCLNLAKVVYKKGLTGTLILGDKFQKIFTALPQYFTTSDWDIHVVANSDIVKDLEQLKALVPELVKGGGIALDTLFDIMTCKSLSEAKHMAKMSVKKQKEEQNIIGQLQQQVQQLTSQLKQSQQELQKAQSKIESLNEQRIQVDAMRYQKDYEVKWFEAQTDRTYKEGRNENDALRTKVELEQLHDGNPYNDTIRQV